MTLTRLTVVILQCIQMSNLVHLKLKLQDNYTLKKKEHMQETGQKGNKGNILTQPRGPQRPASNA